MQALLHSVPRTLQQAMADPCLHQRLLDTHRQVWVSLLGVTAPFSWIPVCWSCVCALPKSVPPVLCKFSWVYGGLMVISSKRFMQYPALLHLEPLAHSRPLLTCTFSGDIHTQFCLSVCVISESWCAQHMFEPSEHLWWVWGLILNEILPLLPFCWGFSALGHGVSPYSRCSTTQPLL